MPGDDRDHADDAYGIDGYGSRGSTPHA
jgi:hypothetical protein